MEKIRWNDREKNGDYYISRGKIYPTSSNLEGRLTGLVISCVETAFNNTFL